jgi:hypothetical protein
VAAAPFAEGLQLKRKQILLNRLYSERSEA